MRKFLVNLRLAWWAVTGQARIIPLEKDRAGCCPYCIDDTPEYGSTCRCGRNGKARHAERVRRFDQYQRSDEGKAQETERVLLEQAQDSRSHNFDVNTYSGSNPPPAGVVAGWVAD